jgi:hypothetical protein
MCQKRVVKNVQTMKQQKKGWTPSTCAAAPKSRCDAFFATGAFHAALDVTWYVIASSAWVQTYVQTYVDAVHAHWKHVPILAIVPCARGHANIRNQTRASDASEAWEDVDGVSLLRLSSKSVLRRLAATRRPMHIASQHMKPIANCLWEKTNDALCIAPSREARSLLRTSPPPVCPGSPSASSAL